MMLFLYFDAQLAKVKVQLDMQNRMIAQIMQPQQQPIVTENFDFVPEESDMDQVQGWWAQKQVQNAQTEELMGWTDPYATMADVSFA